MQEINAAIRREEFLHEIATLKSRGLKEGLEKRNCTREKRNSQKYAK